jgi:hypothetical protein
MMDQTLEVEKGHPRISSLGLLSGQRRNLDKTAPKVVDAVAVAFAVLQSWGEIPASRCPWQHRLDRLPCRLIPPSLHEVESGDSWLPCSTS